MKTYTARLERDVDNRWTVELEEEPRVHTWGKTVGQALARMREAAAMWFEVDEHDVELVPHPVLSTSAGRTVEQARHAREEARNADRLAVERTREAAAVLNGQGISLRDVASILGISHQRVHQLLAPVQTPTRRRAG